MAKKKKEPLVHYLTQDVCLDGTKKVPRGFKACCDSFKYRTTSCLYDVRFEWFGKLKKWGIPLADMVGGGFIEIKYCPHCGKKL
jgi:hypothetical protein